MLVLKMMIVQLSLLLHHRAVNLLGHKPDQHGGIQLGGGEHLQYLHLVLVISEHYIFV